MRHCNLQQLPTELIYIILSQLNARSLLNLCKCSKTLEVYTSVCHDSLWKVLLDDILEYTYDNLEGYNKYNKTKHERWFDVYVQIKNTLDNVSPVKLEENIVRGNADCVKVLLNIDKMYNYDESLILVCKYGHGNILDIMLKHNKVKLSMHSNWGLIIACQMGHTDIVERLLMDGRINPSYENNLAMIKAKQNGYINIVNILIRDPRVNPHTQWNIFTWH